MAWYVDGHGNPFFVDDGKPEPPREKKLDESYLGDGLFAMFDGWQVMLRAPREGGDHWVALEPEVMHALAVWLRKVQALHDTPLPVLTALRDGLKEA